MPLTVGDWDGQPVKMDEQQLRVANVAGHISRRYVQRGTGNEVSMILLVRPTRTAGRPPARDLLRRGRLRNGRRARNMDGTRRRRVLDGPLSQIGA